MRTIATIAAAAVLTVGMAAPDASALTGGNITNSTLSVTYVNIYQPSGVGIKLVPGNYSSRYAGYAYNVAKFMVPGTQNGHSYYAASQYSPAGSYPYRGGVLYNLNGLSLKLRIVELV